MNENNFQIKLQAMLDRVKSIANIKTDIKAIEPKLPKMKIQGTLDSTVTKKELNTKLKSVKPKVKIEADTTQAEKKIRKIGKQKTDPTISPTVDNTKVISGLKQAQKETKTLWERFMSGVVGVNLVRMSVQKVTQAIYQAISAVKELDKIKTDIQTAAGVSDAEVNSMMKSYNQMAKDLSSTTSDVGNAANEIIRMGESLSNTNKLIENSTMLAKIGMIESSQATEYLISSMKGFQVSAENSTGIIDKLTSVDMEAAVSAGGLAEAMSRCANIANSSGTSMDRLIGYMATVGEVTQDSMSIIGNAFKSMYSRMNNIKIGKFVDDETGESLSDTEAVLNKLGIRLRDTEDTYRNFDDVLDDVGKNWKDFTQIEQNAISVAIAGTMQRERFIALMNNYSSALEYSEVAANSAGSALERYGVYQDSIEAKTNELTAAIESLSTNIVSEELYSGIIQATIGLVEFLDKTNLLKTSIAGLVAMGVSKTIISIGTGFITAAKSTAQLSAAMALFDKGRSVENLKSIGAACKGLTDRQLKLVLSTKGLTHGNRLLILAGKGVEESEREQTLTTLGFSAAEDKATASTFSLRGAMNALKTAIALNPIMAIATAVSAAVMAFSAYSNAIEETRQKAKDFGDEIQSTKSEIEDYKNRIEELQNTINDSSSSFDDVSQARKDLMDVQDELIKKFGTEKETIEIITEAINNQADALDLLTKKQYQQWKNEFNNKSFKQSAGDFLASDNIANAFYKLTEFDFSGAWDMLTAPTKSNIDEMVDSMQYAYYKIKKSGNDTLDSLIAKTYNLQDTGSDFVLSGNLNDIYEDLLGIQEMSKDFNVSDRFEASITKAANAMNNTLNDYKEAYSTYVLYEKILNGTEDNQYDEQFNLINQAKEAYDDALVSGDSEKIKEASDEYAQTLQSAIDLAMQNSDFDVADYFKSMYPELQQTFGEWQFNIDFEPNTDGLKDKVANALDSIDGVSDGITSFSVEDIENFNPNIATQEQIDAYGELTNVAETYGLSIKQLITLLQTMGLIQSENYQQLVDTFGLENVDKLSPEDLEIAYTIDNVGNMTFEQLQAEIQRTREMAVETPISITPTISSSIQQLATQLEPQFAELGEAYQAIFTDDGFTLDDVDNSMLEGLRKSFAEIEEEIGVAFDPSVLNPFFDALTNEASTADQVQQAFNDLATAYFYSTETLEQLNDETADAIEKQLEEMGVSNAHEVVLDALALKNEELAVSKQYLAETGQELSSVSELESAAFIASATAAGTCSQQFAALQLQKILCNENWLDSTTDINGLLMLAEAAGIAGDAIAQLYGLKQGYDTAVTNGDSITASAIYDQMRALKTQLANEVANIGTDVKLDFGKIGGGKSAASKAGKDAGEAYADALKNELSNLNDVIGAIGDIINNQIDLYEDQKDAAVEALEAEKKAAEEALEAEKALVQEQIDAKQDEIDKIKEARRERENELDLQQKQYNLARMQNQRTLLVYTESAGMVYKHDTKEIRSAKEAVTEAQENIQIAGLEKEISGLEDIIDSLDKKIEESNKYYDDLIEQTEKYWDSLIKGLEDYKSRWDELAKIEEQAKVLALLEQMGISTDDVLSMSESAFQGFKESYLGLLTEMYKGNDQMLDSLSQVAGVDMSSLNGYLLDTKNSIDDLKNTDLSGLSDSFDNVTASAGNTSNAINGSGGSSTKSSGSGNQTAGSSSGSGDSLKVAIKDETESAIEDLTTQKDLFNGDEGLTNAVQEVIDKIGGGSGGEGSGEGSQGSEGDSDNLKTAIQQQTEEALNEETGIPAQKRAWEELNDPLNQAVDHITTIKSTLEDMDGKTFTVTLNVAGNGGSLFSGEISGTYGGGSGSDHSHGGGGASRVNGTAHIEGTANAKGNWGAKEGGRTLVGELGQELWVHSADGTFETVGNNGAEFIDLKPNDIIFNHLQTKQLLDKGNIIGRGKVNGGALANGTASGKATNTIDDIIITADGKVLIPYDPENDNSGFAKLYKAWNAHYVNVDKNVQDISRHLTMEQNQKMNEEVNRFVNNSRSIVNNNKNVQQPVTVQIGDIHLTGVQDVNGLAQAIKTRMPGKMMQEYFKN